MVYLPDIGAADFQLEHRLSLRPRIMECIDCLDTIGVSGHYGAKCMNTTGAQGCVVIINEYTNNRISEEVILD